MMNTTPIAIDNTTTTPAEEAAAPTRICISNRYIRLLVIIITPAVLIGILSTYYYFYYDSSYSSLINNSNTKDDYHRIKVQVVSNKAIKVVVMVHTAKKYYSTRIIAIRDTWLSKVPEWARVEFYTTMNDALVPLANYSTVMVETQEEPHRGNEQFFVTLRQLYEKYPNVLAFLKVDDDTFINWMGLQSYLSIYLMLSS